MSAAKMNTTPVVTVPLYRHQEEAVRFVCGLFGLEGGEPDRDKQ